MVKSEMGIQGSGKMYYLQLAAFAEGDERQRYMNILVRLAKGMKVCSDKKL